MHRTAIVLQALAATPLALAAAVRPRLDNGVAKTPPMG